MEEDQPFADAGAGRAVAKRAATRVATKAAKHGGRKLLIALGVKGGFWVGLVVLLLLVIAAAAGAASRPGSAAAAGCGARGAAGCAAGDGSWDAGNIISDAVFYDAAAMSVEQIQAFLDRVGGSCAAAGCLRSASYAWGPVSVPWCAPLPGGSGGFAVLLAAVTTACGLNPQVVLVMIQKESQGLTRPPPAALTGFGCPDTGPGGSANCDAGSSGVWAQTWGLVQAFAHLRADPSRINYPVGETSQILWNVAETGCGAGPVLVRNTATASLYTYTPYQPNAASLASYPGTGDRCSSYGNRNFYRLFTDYFGSTGGGRTGRRPGIGGRGAPTRGVDPERQPGPRVVRVGAGGEPGAVHLAGPRSSGGSPPAPQPLWTGLLTELVPLIPGGLTGDLGCFEDRNNVNNPSAVSFHAYGLACDLNFGDNPNGAPGYGRSGRFVIPAGGARHRRPVGDGMGRRLPRRAGPHALRDPPAPPPRSRAGWPAPARPPSTGGGDRRGTHPRGEAGRGHPEVAGGGGEPGRPADRHRRRGHHDGDRRRPATADRRGLAAAQAREQRPAHPGAGDHPRRTGAPADRHPHRPGGPAGPPDPGTPAAPGNPPGRGNPTRRPGRRNGKDGPGKPARGRPRVRAGAGPVPAAGPLGRPGAGGADRGGAGGDRRARRDSTRPRRGPVRGAGATVRSRSTPSSARPAGRSRPRGCCRSPTAPSRSPTPPPGSPP